LKNSGKGPFYPLLTIFYSIGKQQMNFSVYFSDPNRNSNSKKYSKK